VIPSEEVAVALHRKYGSSDRTIRHCETVTRVARILAEELLRRGRDVDKGAVVAGAMLHDIGRSKIQTVRHGAEGAEIAAKEGADGIVVEIIRRHVGAGISAMEAKSLGLPDLDYIPRTLEQRVVCFADKMVDGDRVRPFDAEVQKFTVKKHDVARLLRLKKGLQEELGEDPEKVIFDNIKETA
jgi:uncharacterized protein (TIGR00295 family)